MNIYGLILLALIIFSIFYLKIATYFNIIDKPNKRSSHSVSTIRGGGIVFYFATLLFYIISNFQYANFFLGLTLITFVSFIDDIKTLSSKVRLPFQFLAIFFLLLQIGITYNPIWLFIVLLIIGVGFINIYNFMDGINGITGLYSISILLGLYFINDETQTINQNLIIYSILSLVVFGYYNFRNKARFFAGDVGSISVAMIIFFVGLFIVKETESPMIILFIIVYGADSILTLLYRKYIGEHIMEPHRHHLYQKLVDVNKWSHLKIAGVYAGLQLLINIIIYKTYKLDLIVQFIILFIIITFFIIGYIVLFYRIKLREEQLL